MTREGAIEYLNTLYMALAVFPNQQISLGNIDEMKESVSMAIKALEQKPCDDVVSRQAVLEMAYDMSEIDGEHFTEQCMVVDVEDIQKLPSVRPKPETVTEFADRCRECGAKYGKLLKQEPKTGHWIAVENEEMETIGYYCSECDLPMETEEQTDFCPNCGARMESEDKE